MGEERQGHEDHADGDLQRSRATGDHAASVTDRPAFASLHTEPPVVLAGVPVTLAITARDGNGQPTTDLAVVHERPMHLIAVSEDLEEFAHLHPHASTDETLRVTHTFRTGGAHRLFADFALRDGRSRVVPFDLAVAGSARAEEASADESAGRDDVEMRLVSDVPVRAGEESMLTVEVRDARTHEPVTDLDPYLGALAHFVIIGRGSFDFLHAHPMGPDAGVGAQMPGATGPVVSAHTTFPRPGSYRAWVEVQRNGRVIVRSFDLRVGLAPLPAEHTVAERDGRGEVLVDERHRHGSLAHGGTDPLGGAGPDVPCGEHARHARLEAHR